MCLQKQILIPIITVKRRILEIQFTVDLAAAMVLKLISALL